MGSECTVTVSSHDQRSALPLADRAEAIVRQLESLWSRFLPESELMSLNDHAGSAFGVSPDTFAILGFAVEAWTFTGGLFDPTLLDALIDAGYDRSFDQLQKAADTFGIAESGVRSSPPPTEIGFDPETFSVTLPTGLRLDLGGIGKGRTADIVVSMLERGGADGACVDLGGDISVFGERAEAQPWAVAVDDPAQPGTDLAMIILDEGAVATSSRARRHWRSPAGDAHHLIDPRTGEPATSDLVAVTVVAAEAMWAEVYAKAALIAGSNAGTELLERAGLSALLVADDAQLLPVGAIDGFMIPMGTNHQ